MKYDLETVKQLTAQYGSPLYLFREDDFIRNYKDFVRCFSGIYSRYQLSYSYKTNYTPAICQIVKKLGGYAEVVSDMEYTVAKRIGYANENIIYNGPYKGPLATEHLLNGGILNIDNLQEIERVCATAAAYPERRLKVGLRVNINIGQSFISRFGIDSDSQDLDKAVRRLQEVPNVTLAGLHCHVGQSRTVAAWQNRARIMLALADRLFETAPEYLDLGSGMFAKMEPSLAAQFGNDIPSFADYARAVAEPFAAHYAHLPEQQRPILFTEPGTTVINSYIDFSVRWTALKKSRVSSLPC